MGTLQTRNKYEKRSTKFECSTWFWLSFADEFILFRFVWIENNLWGKVHPEKFFCSEYERSKAAADKIALQAAAEGMPIVPVYPGVVYGPGKLTKGNFVAQLVKFVACFKSVVFVFFLGLHKLLSTVDI